MMMILIVDGELMDVIEMMVDNQADLVVNLEADKVWYTGVALKLKGPPLPTKP